MLDLQPATILWTIVNLLVLYFFFKKYLFGRVNQVLDQRCALVEKDLSQAQDQKNKAQQLKEEYEHILTQAESESAHIVKRSQERGRREYEELLNTAKSDAGKLLQDTREQLAAEREEMLRNARKEVASLALMAAARVSGRSMDDKDDQALVDDFLREAGEL